LQRGGPGDAADVHQPPISAPVARSAIHPGLAGGSDRASRRRISGRCAAAPAVAQLVRERAETPFNCASY
jgi:hypothetical protein